MWEEPYRAVQAAEGKVDELRQGVGRDLIGISNTVENVRREMAEVGGQVMTEEVRAIVEQDVEDSYSV